MVTTTENVKYKEFTWQAIKSLANKVGVNFYSSSTYSNGNGFGLSNARFDSTKIIIEGYERAYGNNEYTTKRLNQVALQNLLLKFELYCLKNNIEYVYVPAVKYEHSFGHSDAYFLIKEGN
jgi:hypothetical protein